MAKKRTFSTVQNKHGAISRRTICVIFLALGAGLVVLCFVFIRNQALQSIAAALFVADCILTLPSIFKKKRRSRFFSPPKKRKNRASSRRDGDRLLPQDKGKIIDFPSGKTKK